MKNHDPCIDDAGKDLQPVENVLDDILPESNPNIEPEKSAVGKLNYN